MNRISIFFDKIYRKLHWLYFEQLKWGEKNLWVYSSYRHYYFAKKTAQVTPDKKKDMLYLTQEPNKGAGIGHQMANWNAGLWYAEYFGVRYAYSPFPSKQWDVFLGFGENEITVRQLCHGKGYKKRKLPYYKEEDAHSMELIQEIIDSYAGQKIVFCNELDQAYKEQYGVKDFIKGKFNSASARKDDQYIWTGNNLNVAIHIRRGDITVGQINQKEELTQRWLNDSYYVKIIESLFERLQTEKEIHLYLFSQGQEEDFAIFKKFPNIHFCLDISARETFLHLVRADILLTSKSSFSYKPALLSAGIKICPEKFWHGYPDEESWILVDDNGNISSQQVETINTLLKKQAERNEE